MTTIIIVIQSLMNLIIIFSCVICVIAVGRMRSQIKNQAEMLNASERREMILTTHLNRNTELLRIQTELMESLEEEQ